MCIFLLTRCYLPHQEANLRKRGKGSSDYVPFSSDGIQSHTSYNSKSWKLPLWKALVILLIGYCSLNFLSKLVDQNFPRSVRIDDPNRKPGVFVAERAYNHVKHLTVIGPRVAGSYENEVRAVDLLLREIGFIKQFANSIHDIQVDFQRPSGVVTPNKPGDGVNTIYTQLANIVVRIASGNNTNSEALLLNSHFDSVTGSPGRSMQLNILFK